METIKKLDEVTLDISDVHLSWIQQHCMTAIQGGVTIDVERKEIQNKIIDEIEVPEEVTVIDKIPIKTPTSKDELIAEIVRAYPVDKFNMTLELATSMVEEVLEKSTNEGTFERFVEVCNE